RWLKTRPRMSPGLRPTSLRRFSRTRQSRPSRGLVPEYGHTAAADVAAGRAAYEPARAGKRWNMEREKEIAKLVNVLRRTSRMALQSEWTGGSQDVAAFCIDQYNRVLARLKEIDPGVGSVFDPLP